MTDLIERAEIPLNIALKGFAMRSSGSRRVMFGIALSCLLSLGCTDHFLRKHTARTASTLTDIMFQQVMDNVAMFCCEPDTLPHFAIIGDGTTQLQDTAQATATPKWNPTGFVDATLGINGGHVLLENWKLQPVMSAGRLKRMRAAFQYVVNPRAYDVHTEVRTSEDGTEVRTFVIADDECRPFLSEMIKLQLLPSPVKPLPTENPCSVECDLVKIGPGGIVFKVEEDALDYLPKLNNKLTCNFPTGWFCCGSRREAPIGCTRVGHYCKQRAWINDCSADALARFTTTVLEIASKDPEPEKTVSFVKRIGSKDDAEGYEITWTLPMSKVCLDIPEEMQPCGNGATGAAFRDLQSHLIEIDSIEPNKFTKYATADSPPSANDIPDIKTSLKAQKAAAKNSPALKTAIDKALNAVKRVESPRSAPVDPSPFDRSGNSPFSKGGTGAEFSPTIVP